MLEITSRKHLVPPYVTLHRPELYAFVLTTAIALATPFEVVHPAVQTEVPVDFPVVAARYLDSTPTVDGLLIHVRGFTVA